MRTAPWHLNQPERALDRRHHPRTVWLTLDEIRAVAEPSAAQPPGPATPSTKYLNGPLHSLELIRT